ncbi:hypothetical protein PHYBLDRAFT_167119 [Phycomyces blakesleeanus NRRL 1555(-)]|uniref:Uncharacterized protein n=1 Tax=Phycomyces blakesleeanus (strain ATCC 8743b / DSM 1359 / FGSC 10004 / NBRC 33097 / NRRL 1555) TaxID=763407 RepID=A0A162UFL1_PHYB8|nr:hypothetical protein PHYBLDRAFT_167119 [Phycomyces blakesleeanus NRRL 1555(-)]OAD74773.1 hypothetical protein PHYBLDRAFT_167119 [Phycomyces blakesleeanus NRRL 1555(-)]|eukprot:XP_018292813.1 hypothetical protein PHYBLDRAFT_167119 [Phycomyces blakesleeanus NRRL 1555(-)]
MKSQECTPRLEKVQRFKIVSYNQIRRYRISLSNLSRTTNIKRNSLEFLGYDSLQKISRYRKQGISLQKISYLDLVVLLIRNLKSIKNKGDYSWARASSASIALVCYKTDIGIEWSNYWRDGGAKEVRLLKLDGARKQTIKCLSQHYVLESASPERMLIGFFLESCTRVHPELLEDRDSWKCPEETDRLYAANEDLMAYYWSELSSSSILNTYKN